MSGAAIIIIQAAIQRAKQENLNQQEKPSMSADPEVIAKVEVGKEPTRFLIDIKCTCGNELKAGENTSFDVNFLGVVQFKCRLCVHIFMSALNWEIWVEDESL